MIRLWAFYSIKDFSYRAIAITKPFHILPKYVNEAHTSLIYHIFQWKETSHLLTKSQIARRASTIYYSCFRSPFNPSLNLDPMPPFFFFAAFFSSSSFHVLRRSGGTKSSNVSRRVTCGLGICSDISSSSRKRDGRGVVEIEGVGERL
jgi:hypothetical protein